MRTWKTEIVVFQRLRNSASVRGKKIVVLTIPAAKTVPVSFANERFIRIGSSKENLRKYPEKESFLFDVLRHGLPTIENTLLKLIQFHHIHKLESVCYLKNAYQDHRIYLHTSMYFCNWLYRNGLDPLSATNLVMRFYFMNFHISSTKKLSNVFMRAFKNVSFVIEGRKSK